MTNDRWKAGLLGLALLAGLGVICPLLAAPYIPLVDPDEGLHAAIAQEMVESGDWIVPRLLGEPYFERPILYFWAIAASLKIFGMSEAAVRLPGLLFGMLGTLTTAAVAWRILGRRTGLIAGAVLCLDDPADGPGSTAGLRRGPGDLGQPGPVVLLGIGPRRFLAARPGHGPPRPAWCWGWPF